MLIWNFTELAGILLAGGFAMAAGLSRKRPMRETYILIYSAFYLVLNGILWIYYLVTSTWQPGEKIFRFDADPLPPAVSFWLGILVLLAIIASWISVWSRRDYYRTRQVWAHSVATLIFFFATLVSALTAVFAQAALDAVPLDR